MCDVARLIKAVVVLFLIVIEVICLNLFDVYAATLTNLWGVENMTRSMRGTLILNLSLYYYHWHDILLGLPPSMPVIVKARCKCFHKIC